MDPLSMIVGGALVAAALMAYAIWCVIDAERIARKLGRPFE